MPEGPVTSSRRPAALHVSVDTSASTPELLTSTATAAAMTFDDEASSWRLLSAPASQLLVHLQFAASLCAASAKTSSWVAAPCKAIAGQQCWLLCCSWEAGFKCWARLTF
jgi:hypothetical protein